MINRGNWRLIQEYLNYRKDVDLVSFKTIRLEESWLRYLLEWMNDKPFKVVASKRPTYPEYLINSRKGKKPFAGVYLHKLITSAKRFFEWLVIHHNEYSHHINPVYLATLKTPKVIEHNKEHEYVTIEEIRAMAKAPVYSMRDKRIRAAAVFWFLSGIRIGAFVTLPIKAIDLNDLSVKQWPEYGVMTKNSKHATTYLLNMPDLLEVVKEWDRLIRTELSEDSYWFAPLSPETGMLDSSIQEIGHYRESRARKDLLSWLDQVGLAYHSPHKFRHGNAVYSLKQSRNIQELKSVSQNLMHKNLDITDGVYGVLSTHDVGETIKKLGENINQGNMTKAEIIFQISELLGKL